MLATKIFAIIFLTFWNTKHLNSLSSLNIRWKSINCTTLSEAHVAIFTCIIKELPRNRGNYIQVHTQFKEVIESLPLHFILSFYSDGKKGTEFVNVRYDGCRNKNQQTNPVVNTLLQQLLQSHNFTDCPLKANTTYTLKKVQLFAQYYPAFVPNVNFSITVNIYTKRIHVSAVNAIASVIKKI